jgi:hypothetical protein
VGVCDDIGLTKDSNRDWIQVEHITVVADSVSQAIAKDSAGLTRIIETRLQAKIRLQKMLDDVNGDAYCGCES